MRWRQFSAELIDVIDALGGTLVVTLGALLADSPHTRPIPVSGTSTEPDLVDRLNLEVSSYEGPTGIVGVFQDACVNEDLPAVSYWPRCRTTWPSRRAPRRPWRWCTGSRSCSRYRSRWASSPMTPGRGSAASTSSPRTTRTSPSTCAPRGVPRHRRAAGGER